MEFGQTKIYGSTSDEQARVSDLEVDTQNGLLFVSGDGYPNIDTTKQFVQVGVTTLSAFISQTVHQLITQVSPMEGF